MNYITEAMEKNLNEIYPAGLHERVMRGVFFIRHKNIFLTAVVAVACYFFLAIWRLWVTMSETEFIGTFQALADGAGANIELIFDAIGKSLELAPLGYAINFIISVALALYFFRKIKTNYKFLKLS